MYPNYFSLAPSHHSNSSNQGETRGCPSYAESALNYYALIKLKGIRLRFVYLRRPCVGSASYYKDWRALIDDIICRHVASNIPKKKGGGYDMMMIKLQGCTEYKQSTYEWLCFRLRRSIYQIKIFFSFQNTYAGPVFSKS